MRLIRAFLAGRAAWPVLLAAYFLALLGARALNVPDEGRYSEVAREMLMGGDWITPRVNGAIFLDKPILHYWLEAAALWVFGFSEWSVRLVPALAGIAGVLLVYVSARLWFGRRAAWLSAAVLATNPLYFLASQYADMSLEVAVWIGACLLCFSMSRRLEDAAARRLMLCAWAAAGCAVLTKGLIGVVLPGGAIFAWLLWTRRWRDMRGWRWGTGGVVFATVVLPWYLMVQQRNPDFAHYFFIYQQFERFKDSGFNNSMPVWFYVAVLAAGLLPWSVFLPAALRSAWRGARGLDGIPPGEGDELKLLLAWPAVILLFFSIPDSKIVGYILPAVAPLAILAGRYLGRRFPAEGMDRAPPLAAGVAAAAAACLLLVWAAGHYDHRSIRPLALELKPRLQPGDMVVNYRNYYQDLPLYLDTREPITVVSEWQARDILKADNWRREFYFALRRQPEAGRWLIDEPGFARLLDGHPRVYVFSDPAQAAELARRYNLAPVGKTRSTTLLATPAAAFAVTPPPPP